VSAVYPAVVRGSALAVVALSLFGTACGGDRRAPPGAPAVASPVDVVPPDLDWVLRLDVGRVHAALGKTVVASLRQKALESRAEGAQLFLMDALERARVVVVATRYERGEFADFVIALDGDFKGLDPRAYAAEPPWQRPLDLGGDVRRWDRKKPKARSDVMRLYGRSNELFVAATEAELDSLEAVIEEGASPNLLKPQERGFLSAAVRTRLELPSDRFPELARALAGVRSVEGFVDTHGDGFRVEASGELASEAHAKQAAQILEAARSAFEGSSERWASLARHTTIEAQGGAVVVRAELVREVLGDIVGDALR
jgi:hypothetical protein